MALASKASQEQQDERVIKLLSRAVAKQGIVVRREKLSRGSAYRVKSGDCVFSGENMLFLDKELPIKQQVTMLIDWLLDKNIQLCNEDISLLPNATQEIFQRASW